MSTTWAATHAHAEPSASSLPHAQGPQENRLLLTGLHVVADIYCNACDTRLGWKYVEAFEETQKYKEGKYILEKAMTLKVRRPPATCACDTSAVRTSASSLSHFVSASRLCGGNA